MGGVMDIISWFFFVNRGTGNLEALLMSDGYADPLSADFGVDIESPSTSDYWTPVNASDISKFLNDNYFIYEYDATSENEDSQLLDDLDPAEDLDWEITAVQRWVKGEVLHRRYIERISFFLGPGSAFKAEDVIAGNIRAKLTGESSAGVAVVNKLHPRCLWCGVRIERRYNFALNAPINQRGLEDFENPIVWSDGMVLDAFQTGSSLAFPAHYGDSVLECKQCGAAFLASVLEKEYPRRQSFPDSDTWSVRDSVLIEGDCGHQENTDLDSISSVTMASLAKTMLFLKKAQSQSLINWSEWTALQQAVNKLISIDRQAKVELSQFTSPFESDLRQRMSIFIDRISQIKAGTIGSMSPFTSHHLMEIEDENFWVHNYGVQEILPVANMMRICGAFSYDWAAPNHPAIPEAGKESGWSEFDQWIALRGKALILALEQKNTDWAIAIDSKGRLVELGYQ